MQRGKEKLLGCAPWIGIWLAGWRHQSEQVGLTPQEGARHQAMKLSWGTGEGWVVCCGFPNLLGRGGQRRGYPQTNTLKLQQ